MKINTPKVFSIKSNQKTTNKCLDKYINSRIKTEDNSFLSSTLKSSNNKPKLKLSGLDKTPKAGNKKINDYVSPEILQLEESAKEFTLYDHLSADEPSTKNSGMCNYETSAEEIPTAEFRTRVDHIRAIVLELAGETKNRNLLARELDDLHRKVVKMAGGCDEGEIVDLNCINDVNITQHSKSISIYKEQLSGNNMFSLEVESLRQENMLLRKKVEENDLRYTKFIIENESLKNQLKDKTKSHDSMQKTLFLFQKNLNDLGKNNTTSYSKVKSKPSFTPSNPSNKSSFIVTKTPQVNEIKPQQEDEAFADYNESIVDTILNEEVKSMYYLPKKIEQKPLKHELPKLYFVNIKLIL
jgi:hypothetical protein